MPGTFDLADIALAAHRLAQGKLVAFPTETVYGLGADATNPAAIAAVFALKGRPSTNPLIVHVTGHDMALGLVAPGAWSDDAQRLARVFWPGSLSLVLPKAASVPDIITAGGPTVALRCPNHPAALALLYQFSKPLVGPSANRSGRVSPTTAQHVRESFPDADVMVLDGGPCVTGIESTVLSLTEAPPRILRPGVVGAAAIAAVLGRPVTDAIAKSAIAKSGGDAANEASAILASPGLLDHHYAPHHPAALVSESDFPALAAHIRSGGRLVLITHRLIDHFPEELILAMPPAAHDYAAALYDALRHADARTPTLIAIERPPTRGATDEETAIWRAVADRLSRAARSF